MRWGQRTCRAENRKEALAKAAEEMRESGKSAAAFSESQYAVSEDKSPNVHTRQVKCLQAQLACAASDYAQYCVCQKLLYIQEEGVRESAD